MNVHFYSIFGYNRQKIIKIWIFHCVESYRHTRIHVYLLYHGSWILLKRVHGFTLILCYKHICKRDRNVRKNSQWSQHNKLLQHYCCRPLHFAVIIIYARIHILGTIYWLWKMFNLFLPSLLFVWLHKINVNWLSTAFVLVLICVLSKINSNFSPFLTFILIFEQEIDISAYK